MTAIENTTPEIEDILYFETSLRGGNDLANKKREDIIVGILNQDIPNEYFLEPKWKQLKDQLVKFLSQNFGISDWTKMTAKKTAGRRHHTDFEISYPKSKTLIQKYNIEWKFGAEKITDCPQFVSPARPNQYMTKKFDEYFYDEYLSEVCSLYGTSIPDKSNYLKQINSIKPECMVATQESYYRGAKKSSRYTGDEIDIEKTNKCKDISKEAITQFFPTVELKKDVLNEYLKQSQKDKHYMLYKDGLLYYDTHTPNDYIIEVVEKKAPYFVCKTISGKTMKILLRWKNGNGIAYPAFQIK